MRFYSNTPSVRRGPILVTACVLILTACGSNNGSGGDGQAEFQLTYASYFNAEDVYGEAETWWAEEIEDRTDGRVQIDIHFSGSLVAQDALLPAIGQGRVDLGAPVEAYQPAELPLSQIASLPFTTRNGEAQSRAFHDLYENYDPLRLEFERQNVHVLWFMPTTPNTLASSEPVTTIEDLKGMRIRTYGTMTDALSGIGAAPASFPLPEVYESVDRGVINGGFTGMELIADLRWYEAAPNITDLGTGLYTLVLLSINKDVWDRMPEEIQDIITEVSLEGTDATEDIYREAGDRACETILAASSSKVSVLDEAEVAKWSDAVRQDLIDDWMSQAGEDADDFFDQYTEAIERYEAESDRTSALEQCAERD